MTADNRKWRPSIPADQELARVHQTIREIEGEELASLNHATARNTVQEELGRFGAPEDAYNLSDQTRDILLVHSRQDAAWGALNSQSILEQIKGIRRLLLALLMLTSAGVLLLLWHIRAS
ncbi:hypothetical protein [Aurantimonas sp. VKM B-3413]|uniref:hypothetical protein n=1 Tax=Aurantimonas sp. VKM B-3413 TaxID=2779401 RepID=UPI001E2EB946|nr:hypothetical protein [Aurantimonas sp. VKM B-3413]MCB8835915.1 hypothetical protein [Aurantimonas sp. VKM B-3413]